MSIPLVAYRLQLHEPVESCGRMRRSTFIVLAASRLQAIELVRRRQTRPCCVEVLDEGEDVRAEVVRLGVQPRKPMVIEN